MFLGCLSEVGLGAFFCYESCPPWRAVLGNPCSMALACGIPQSSDLLPVVLNIYMEVEIVWGFGP